MAAYDFLEIEKKKAREGIDIQKGREVGGILGHAIKKDKPKVGLIDLMDRADRLKDEVKKANVLEEGNGYRIVKKKGEKTPIYLVSLPHLSKNDREVLKKVERKAIAEINIDPTRFSDGEKLKSAFMDEVSLVIEMEYPNTSIMKRKAIAELIVQNMVGYGLLDPLLSDDALEEVMLVATKKEVYVYHRKHGMCRTNILFENDKEAENIITRIGRSIGRSIDVSSPLLDARLPDGSRVNATLPPVSLDGPSLTIRKFKADPLTIIDIINFGTLSVEVAALLWLLIEGYGVKPANVLVSGGTSSGKTTTLNCLGSFIPSTDRILSIEDTAELQLPVEHWIKLETRPPNIEGRGEISMDMLLKNALRMRPDRIIVGEVRGEEARTLLAAMNTGQSGCLGTVHANTARETITRLTSDPMGVPVMMIPALNLVLMQNRLNYRGRTVRKITEIAEIVGIKDEDIQLNTICTWDPKQDLVKTTGVPSSLKAKLAGLRGVGLEEVDKEIERREEVLKWMIKNNKRSIREVGEIINQYYINPNFLEDTLKKTEVEIKVSRGGEVIEKDELHRLVRVKSEKNPIYEVILPSLNSKEKGILAGVERRAINEIEVDPTTMKDKKKAKEVFIDKVSAIIKRDHPQISVGKRKDVARLVVQNMISYGLLEPLLSDDNLEEIMVVGTNKKVYVNQNKYGICKTNIVFEEDEGIERIVEKIASSVGRRIDKSLPLLDARLPDGSRVNATLPPISVEGPTLTIRKFRADPLTIVDLINFKTLNSEVAAYLWFISEGYDIKPGNILVAGGSGSGKTTTLNCLCSFISLTERVITIEDTAELRLPIKHCIRMETRPPNVEGIGEVAIDDLVKNTLRMRPDRIIVGEVRGEEARTLFTAMNTGHDGCMGTVHSNSARDTITRLINPPMNVPKIMIPGLDLILMVNKIYLQDTTLRRITEIAELSSQKDEITLNNVYEWDPKRDELKPTGVPSLLKQKIAGLKGVGTKEVDEEMGKREKVLTWMVKKNKRNIKEVAEIFNRYYSDPEGLMNEIAKDT